MPQGLLGICYARKSLVNLFIVCVGFFWVLLSKLLFFFFPPLSTETYEDFDSRVIEVSVTCPFPLTGATL